MVNKKIKNMRFGWNEYFKPTPKNIRILGDSIAAACTFGATLTILEGNTITGTVVLWVGIIGKFVSNFFSGEHRTIFEDEYK